MIPSPQQEAILSQAKLGKNFQIIARAGCGKSTTLCMIAEELYPKSVIMLAFNKSAQQDLERKLSGSANAKALTFNSLGHRSMTGRLTLNKRKPFLLLDDISHARNISFSRGETAEFITLLNAARRKGLVPPGKGGSPLAPWTDEAWQDLFEEQEAEPTNLNLEIAQQLLSYSIERMASGLIDFVDQLYRPAIWGGNFPYAHTYMVDEAQDLDPLQHKLLKLLPCSQIIAVGDDRQAIYAFRGAYSDSMHRLREALGGESTPILPLSHTYRCAKSIVERQKSLVPDFESASHIEGKIEDWRGRPWNSTMIPNGMAILCRNNAPLLTVALRLFADGRKVSILGRDFAEKLQRDIEKAVGKDAPSSLLISSVLEKLEALYVRNSKNKDKKLTAHESDRIAALRAISESRMVRHLGDLRTLLSQIFTEETAAITLATAHKAKGLEWPIVMHLSPSLIPSPWAKTEEEQTQEANIAYVLETRPKEILILAELEDME